MTFKEKRQGSSRKNPNPILPILNIRNLFLVPIWVLSLIILISPNHIYLWDFTVTGDAVGGALGEASSGFRFGLWGYCFDGLDLKAFGLGGDVIPPDCVKTSFGIHIDPKVAKPLHLTSLEDAFNGLIHALVAFHVILFIATTLALIANNVLPVWSMTKASSADASVKKPVFLQYAAKSLLWWIVLATTMALVAFVIDITVASKADNELDKLDVKAFLGLAKIDFDAGKGPIIWLILVAALLLVLLTANEIFDFIGRLVPSLSVKKPAADPPLIQHDPEMIQTQQYEHKDHNTSGMDHVPITPRNPDGSFPRQESQRY